MKTREQLRKEWLVALRSGEYERGYLSLVSEEEDGDCYCCLGVLCKIAGILEGDMARYGEDSSTTELPPSFARYMGMNGAGNVRENKLVVGLDTSLMHMNDSQEKTFDEIADAIETGDYYEDPADTPA